MADILDAAQSTTPPPSPAGASAQAGPPVEPPPVAPEPPGTTNTDSLIIPPPEPPTPAPPLPSEALAKEGPPPKKKSRIGVLLAGLLLLAITLPIAILAVKQQVEIRSRAAGVCVAIHPSFTSTIALKNTYCNSLQGYAYNATSNQCCPSTPAGTIGSACSYLSKSGNCALSSDCNRLTKDFGSGNGCTGVLGCCVPKTPTPPPAPLPACYYCLNGTCRHTINACDTSKNQCSGIGSDAPCGNAPITIPGECIAVHSSYTSTLALKNTYCNSLQGYSYNPTTDKCCPSTSAPAPPTGQSCSTSSGSGTCKSSCASGETALPAAAFSVCGYSGYCCIPASFVDKCTQGTTYCVNASTVAVCKADKSGYTQTACTSGTTCNSTQKRCVPTSDGGTTPCTTTLNGWPGTCSVQSSCNTTVPGTAWESSNSACGTLGCCGVKPANVTTTPTFPIGKGCTTTTGSYPGNCSAQTSCTQSGAVWDPSNTACAPLGCCGTKPASTGTPGTETCIYDHRVPKCVGTQMCDVPTGEMGWLDDNCKDRVNGLNPPSCPLPHYCATSGICIRQSSCTPTDVATINCREDSSCTGTTPPQCINIIAYKDGNALSQTELNALQPGDIITLAFAPGGAATKVHFRVNTGSWNETTTKNANGQFTWNYTLENATSFTIEAQWFDGSAWH